MTHAQASPPAEPNVPAPQPPGAKSKRFWRAFWLTFLVGSLAYAWHSFYVPSNSIAWADSYTAAQEQAVESDKPVILFFTGAWCVPCRIMKREVWADDEVADAVHADFIPVLIDVDDPDATAVVSRYRIGVTPTTIIADPQGEVLRYEQGGLSKASFLELLAGPDSAASEEL